MQPPTASYTTIYIYEKAKHGICATIGFVTRNHKKTSRFNLMKRIRTQLTIILNIIQLFIIKEFDHCTYVIKYSIFSTEKYMIYEIKNYTPFHTNFRQNMVLPRYSLKTTFLLKKNHQDCEGVLFPAGTQHGLTTNRTQKTNH